MPTFNILDHRTNDNVHFCDAVYEIFSDDWSALGLPRETVTISEWVDNRSIYDIICTAQRFAGCVTVYLYDADYITRNHGFVAAWHTTLKEHPLDAIGYDPRILRKNL